MLTLAGERISIIIPCFNAERWLAQAIRSALEQTLPPAEVVVVDDGSTDSSAEAARSFGSLVHYVRQAKRGSCAARNFGLSIASGRLIQYLDADDLLHKRRFELLIEAWRAAPDAQFAASGYRSYRSTEIDDREISEGDLAIRAPRILRNVLAVNYLPVAGLFRKSFLESIGPWNESLTRWVDLEFHSRIAAHSRTPIPFVDLPLYGYRQHDGSRISSQNRNQTNLDAALCALSAAEAHFKTGGEIGGSDKSYFFPMYVQLARGYAKAGEREKFLRMLERAAFLSPRASFRFKAHAARAFSRLFVVRAVSNVLERVLPPMQ